MRMYTGDQQTLFTAPIHFPHGFVYRQNFITLKEEQELIGYLEDLPLEHATGSAGYKAKRRSINFGWNYDFAKKKMIRGSALPPFLLPLARRVAKWLDIETKQVIEALVSEYTPGSAIGWHRDNEPVTQVIGVSLGAPCILRLRPLIAHGVQRQMRDVISLAVEPRSAYILQKDARTRFQHSIPIVDTLRYSITFRTMPSGKSF